MRRAFLVVLAVTAVPWACGGNAFTAAPADGGAHGDAAAVDGAGADTSPTGDSQPGFDGSDGPGPETSPDAMPPAEGGGDVLAVEGGDALSSDAGGLAGTVIDSQWQPVPNALVVLPGTGNSTHTDAGGMFTLPMPGGRYDVAVLSMTSSGTRHGYLFHGLSRPDPTLQLIADSAPTANARVSGAVAQAAGVTNGLVLADLDPSVIPQSSETVAFNSTASTYAETVYWVGSGTIGATIYALEWSSTGGIYYGYASAPVNLSNGGAATYDVSGGSIIATGQIAPTISVSPGYSLNNTWLYWRPAGSKRSGPLLRDTSGTSTPFYATPAASGTTLDLCAHQTLSADAGSASDAGATSSPPYGDACVTSLLPTSTPAISLPVAPVFVSPPSSGVTTTTPFSWKPAEPSGVVYTIAFTSSAAGAPQFYVLTSTTDAQIPDFSTAGAALPSGTAYAAAVTSVGPFADVDAAAGPAGYYGLVFARLKNAGPPADGTLAYGGATSFVTQ